MATVKPFRAIRPKSEYASKVNVAHSDAGSDRIKFDDEENKYSFLNISRAERGLPEELLCDEVEIRKKTEEVINAFKDGGVLQQDESPCMYVYRLTSQGRSQTGVIACIHIFDYINGSIKRHELTRHDKVETQIKHLDRCRANIEPVLLVHKNLDSVKSIVRQYQEMNDPEYDFEDNDEVKHELWVISDEDKISDISASYENLESLYIADGHHRVEAAAQKSNADSDEEINYLMALMFPDDEVKIFDYNRAVKDLNGLNKDEFFSKIKEQGFIVAETGEKPKALSKHGEFAMFLDECWYTLTYVGEREKHDPISNIDVSILQSHLLDPILGIKNPRTDSRITFISGTKGMIALENATRTDMRVAFAVPAISMQEVMDIADAGLTMPPKSTCFAPKPGLGLMMHELHVNG